MERIGPRSLATIRFELNWKSAEASHCERYLGRKVNLWRDIFPPGLKEGLLGLGSGDSLRLDYDPGEAIPLTSVQDRVTLPATGFSRKPFLGLPVQPRVGRFYPRCLLGNLPGPSPQDCRPARVLSLDRESIAAELSHPLAGRPLSLSATVDNAAANPCETGGRLTHWLEAVADNGPGMQARATGVPTDFSGGRDRADAGPDPTFYAAPRLTDHLDAQARAFLAAEHARLVPLGGRVLDLMSSVRTHLSADHAGEVTGLGLNAEELAANPQLTERVVHDLNAAPALPFADASFDAALCAMSLEYLTDPAGVVAEAARVLKPGAPLVLSFSDRWFPAKVTRLWLELHEFERLGFALDLLLQAGRFTGLETLSVRNWWRPEDDPHIRQTWVSDPVYMAVGFRA